MRSVALVNGDIMPGFVDKKGPHVIVVPHNLPSELLLRMWRQDRAAALAAMDQPPFLRQVFPRGTSEGLLAPLGCSDIRSLTNWNFDRTRFSTRAPATGDRATGASVFLPNRNANHSTTINDRTGLHLRRADEERQTLLAPRTRPSALLATQRAAGDVAAGEAGDQRVTYVLLCD